MCPLCLLDDWMAILLIPIYIVDEKSFYMNYFSYFLFYSNPTYPASIERIESDPCAVIHCHPNATCQNGLCLCLPGFQGDGYRECRLVSGECLIPLLPRIIQLGSQFSFINFFTDCTQFEDTEMFPFPFISITGLDTQCSLKCLELGLDVLFICRDYISGYLKPSNRYWWHNLEKGLCIRCASDLMVVAASF